MDQHIKRLIEKYILEASQLSGEEALDKYQMAYIQAMELGNAFTLRACAANLGTMYISLGTRKAAQAGLEFLEKAAPPEGVSDCVSNGDLFFNMGLGLEVVGRFEKAYMKMHHALKEYQSERDNPTMEIAALKKLVKISRDRQKTEDAIDWCHKLEEAYGRTKKQPVEQLRTILQRANLQKHLGEEDRTQCYQMLAEIRQNQMLDEIGDKKKMITVEILVEISVEFTRLDQREKAQEFLEEANSLLGVEYDQSLQKAIVLQNLGALYNYLKDWKTALQFHSQATEIYHLYTTFPPDPNAPIQPLIALRCKGHCVANHAYAMLKLDKLDEACKLFRKALELAEQSGDVDSKWQIEETLGAIYFCLACLDLGLPSPRNANLKVLLWESCMRYLDKSLEWFNMALKHSASGPRGTDQVQDRVLKKYTHVKTFKDNAILPQLLEPLPLLLA